MNLLKIFGGVAAGILAAGGLIVAGRTGLGTVEKPDENPETTPEGDGATPAETPVDEAATAEAEAPAEAEA